MRRVITKKLVPGMIAAEDVYSFSDQLLVAKGTVLTETAIGMLDVHHIISIRVEEAVAPAAEAEAAVKPAAEAEAAVKPAAEAEAAVKAEPAAETEAVSKPAADTEAPKAHVLTPDTTLTNSERIRRSPEFARFKADYDDQIGSFRKSVISSIEKEAPIDTEALLEDTLSLLKDTKTATGVFDMLHCMREYDDSTFSHCINVSLICNVFAKWLHMSEEDVRVASACGLFYDIGKLKIPQEILEKPSGLTPEEFKLVRTHTTIGYQLLQAQGAETHVCNAALMHHERCDGSGYPMKLSSAQIDRFAKLVAIADVYDAMTSARSYRKPFCPFAVIEIYEQEGLQKYDPQYILPFLENMGNTYISSHCRLSNGKVGDIIYINKDKLSRPLVRCGAEYINLAEQANLRIETLL